MGVCGSTAPIGPVSMGSIVMNGSGGNRKWKQKISKERALKLYIDEGTLPEGCSRDLLELRAYLDDPLLFRGLAEFAKNKDLLTVLMCWIEILEYKYINDKAVDYQIGKALHIYYKYVQSCAVVALPFIKEKFTDEWRANLGISLVESMNNNKAISPHLFDGFLHQCLEYMLTVLYLPYKRTESYSWHAKRAKQSYNQVSLDDFEYYEELGQGGFGLVVHCKKKSTDKHYALKIQTKVGLLECFADDPARVMLEREAASHCHHNFIISMDYAFQTDALAIMVVDLGTCGTLADAMNLCDERMMPECRVVFYAAEIILALSHIHRVGMIYRDLKPGNVLLGEDGHIKLVDMGGVVDVGGKVFGSSKADMDEMFSGEGGRSQYALSHYVAEPSTMNRGADSEMHAVGGTSHYAPSTTAKGTASHSMSAGAGGGPSIMGASTYRAAALPRALSVMGTGGYMAPEMMIIIHNGHNENRGYTCSVDFWSLGIMMYKLLTSCTPFHNNDVASFMHYVTAVNGPILGSPEPKPTPSRNESGISTTASPSDVAFSENEAPPMSAQADVHTYAPHVTKHPALISAFERLDEIRSISVPCKAVIAQLLEVDETRRLGSGVKGLRRIKRQLVFKDVNWLQLSQKHVTPPFKPEPTFIPDHQPHESFESMMTELGKARWLRNTLRPAGQKFFEAWDWISPSILKAELGIASTMEQYDSNLKLKQFFGSDATSGSLNERTHVTNSASFSRGKGNSDVALVANSIVSKKMYMAVQSKEVIEEVLNN